MRYPVIIVFVLGGLILLGWLLSGRRIPALVHVGAVFAALGTVAFLLWLRSAGKEIEPEAWAAVLVLPIFVYVSFAFIHAMHSEEKHESASGDSAMPPSAPAVSETWAPEGLGTLLTPDERARAAALSVWTVWWELPDKSWEAFCLDAGDAEKLLALKRDDHLVKSWGKAGMGARRTLLEWHDAATRGKKPPDGGDERRTAREILRRAGAGERVPLVIRGW